MTKEKKQPYALSIRQLFKIVEPQVVGGGRVLAIWLEEFLGDIRHYVSLTGKSLMKVAATLQGNISLGDFIAAAEQTQTPVQGRAPPRGLSKILSQLLPHLNKG
ncbi:MAG: hypothetical protein WC612_02110 [Bdellovibrionales bacterium]|jgi:hypothetical protein